MNTFGVLSYIPGTRSWQIYRETRRYVDDCTTVLQANFDGIPDFPRIPRTRSACVAAVETMCIALKAWRYRELEFGP